MVSTLSRVSAKRMVEVIDNGIQDRWEDEDGGVKILVENLE